MNKSTISSLADAAADALTIDAFDTFRSAAREAALPLPILDAFAAYKTAVDFTLLALEAAAEGDQGEAEKLTRWADEKLADMREELAKLGFGTKA